MNRYLITEENLTGLLEAIAREDFNVISEAVNELRRVQIPGDAAGVIAYRGRVKANGAIWQCIFPEKAPKNYADSFPDR